MAIYGIGAYYTGTDEDMTDEFISKGYACIGWREEDAMAIHRFFRRIEDGDIIYIKSYPHGTGLYIKAIGIVTDSKVNKKLTIGEACIRVKWIWTGKEKLGKMKDGYNVRSTTLYEEQNPDVRRIVLELLFSRLKV